MIMIRICQSCGMVMLSDDFLGDNEDGSINEDYCRYCFRHGKFTDDVPMDEFIEHCLKYSEHAGMTRDEMRAYCRWQLPQLKRWQSE